MRRLCLVLFGYLQHLAIPASSTDFENAHIIGVPRITCSSKTINLQMDTNIPFQGRISVIGNIFTPACNRDYSSNILKNASFDLDIIKCTESQFLSNGSRILRAHVEIGFHPLVMTNSDRIFLVECLDNTILPIINVSSNSVNCTHLVRMASEWKSMTEFRIGDAIVHEWSCQTPHSSKMLAFLTNCNALSQSGQKIHLIDENGCVIDSELMGDIVYNDHIPKLYARARVFKFLTDEKYRIECSMEFCNNGSSCKERPFPPKCAFTKEEIISRSTQSKSEQNSITIMPSALFKPYDFKLEVSSAWLTIKFNQYTETKNLHKRYHLRTILDSSLQSFKPPASEHFLSGLAYRDPLPTSKTKSQFSPENNGIDNAHTLHSSGFQPVLNPPINSREEFIETITFGNQSGSSGGLNNNFVHTNNHLHSKPTIATAPLKKLEFENLHSPEDSKAKKPELRLMTEKPESSNEITAPNLREETVQTSSSPPSTEMPTTAPSPRRRLTPTTPYLIPSSTTTETTTRPTLFRNALPLDHKNTTIYKEYDKFVSKNGDWRFDDRAINDSDAVSEKQTFSCLNTTIISSQRQCKWSGVENLLLVWSFASLLVWMMLIAIFLHKYSRKKPQWVSFREQELERVAQSRVLGQEYPWMHADAFEDRNKNKNEMEVASFNQL